MIDDLLMQRIKSYEPLPLPSPQPLAASAQEIVRRRQELPQTNKIDAAKVAENVIGIVENPDLMQQTVNAAGEHLDDVAPETAQDMRNTMSRMLFFLASKAPKPSFSSPGMPPLPPAKKDVLRFERYLSAVNDPTSILDDADDGVLTPETVEAVKTVYPKMYEMMQTELAGKIQNMPKISYKKRMQLSSLLGQDMAGTLRPQVMLMAQGVYGNQVPQQQREQMPVYRAKGLRVAERSAEYDSVARRNAQIGARR